MTPDPVNNNVKPSNWSKVKRTSRNILRWVTAFVIFLILVFFYWKYYITYKEGSETGILQEFSRRGNLFKTYEGTLLKVSGIPGNTSAAVDSPRFTFSVTNDSVAVKLDNLQGKMVKVRYHEKHASIFWRGDSEHIVVDVTPQ